MWQVFTNMTLGTDGTVVVDLAAGPSTRFYRLTTSRSLSLGISFVKVGDAGNAADPDHGYGAVGYKFDLQKFEFTITEYVEFLNTVGDSNPNGIYQTVMGSDARGGNTQSGATSNVAYAVKANIGGNVWEWDDGVAFGLGQVLRGGGWGGNATDARSDDRNGGNPDDRSGGLGSAWPAVQSRELWEASRRQGRGLAERHVSWGHGVLNGCHRIAQGKQ